jgi:hypothetical protein
MELLAGIVPLLLAAGYATALSVSKAEPAKGGFLRLLFRTVGEMPDPFYRR